MKVYLEMKQTLICFLSEEINNSEQELICITCEIAYNYWRYRIRESKNTLRRSTISLKEEMRNIIEDEKEIYLKKINEDRKTIYSMKISCMEICPFICKKKHIGSSGFKGKDKRKLVEEFMVTYEFNTVLKYILKNSYLIFYEYFIDFSKIYSNLSYYV
jgi:hypothetical protein